MRLIAGDVGGTKTLLEFIDDGVVRASQRYESGRFKTLDLLLTEFITTCPDRADAACFAVAGPVFEGKAEVTNLHWVMEQSSLESGFQIRRISLINDFFAIALGVPLLKSSDLVSLQLGERQPRAPIAIVGAGTGLGEAMVVFEKDVWNVIPSEGGHADFAPQDERQAKLFVSLHEQYGHVSWERLLSGAGLVNIFTFLTGRTETAAAISALADNGDADALEAFSVFVDIYGAEAGNMALRLLSRGGVFLAGGVAAKNIGRFTDGRFMEAFLRKGRFQEMLRAMPVDLIVDERVGLIGAAEMARRIA